MLGWLTGSATLGRSSRRLYARIVADARRPELFTGCGIPDTMDSRLEVILLHLVLVLERLKVEGVAGQRLGQRVMECMVADLDDAFRQVGLGDDSVARRLPRIASALAERARDYSHAADLSESIAIQTLARALDDHVFRAGTASGLASPGGRCLADYAQATRRRLARADFRQIAEGTYPEPDFAPSNQGTSP